MRRQVSWLAVQRFPRPSRSVPKLQWHVEGCSPLTVGGSRGCGVKHPSPRSLLRPAEAGTDAATIAASGCAASLGLPEHERRQQRELSYPGLRAVTLNIGPCDYHAANSHLLQAGLEGRRRRGEPYQRRRGAGPCVDKAAACSFTVRDRRPLSKAKEPRGNAVRNGSRSAAAPATVSG